MEEIVIEIDAQGNVVVEGKGIAGTDCVALTKEIEQALGEVQTKTKTRDYYVAPRKAKVKV